MSSAEACALVDKHVPDFAFVDIHLLDGMEQWVPHLTLHRLPGISHWVQQDAPDAVNTLLVDWLGAK